MSLSSLLPRRDLVDFIQNQLALISSSTAITCATAKLAPLRGALQAAVALHAVVIVCAGLRTEQPEEVARMEQYLREISANDSYLRILPEPVLALFASIEEALEGMVDGSLPQPAEASPTEEHPVDPVDTATIPEDHPRETPCDCSFPVSPTSNTRPPTVEDDHPPTTIIIDESLLQQRELLRCDHHFGMTHRTLEVQYGVSYICRSVRPLSMVVDVDTGVLLTSLLELLDATRLRAVVNSLAGETVRYDRLIVVIETHDTDTKEITTPLQCLLAGIMFFPVETMIHFSSHRIPSSYIGPALQTRQAASGSASTLCTAVRPRGEWTLSPFSTVGLLLPAGLLDGRRNGTAAVVLHHSLREPVRGLLHQLSRWKCWKG